MRNLKKMPGKKLEKFSTIFMQLGLVLVLFLVYVILEHKTEQLHVVAFKPLAKTVTYLPYTQEIVFTKEVKQPVNVPQEKPKTVFIDKIVKGENTIIETIIEKPAKVPTEFTADAIIEIKEPEELGVETVPFVNIQNAPVFKGCEGLAREENKQCFDKKIKQFVQHNFDAELANELGLRSGKHKIQTQFLIDDKGFVVDIKIRAPHKTLERETEILLEKLPKFLPGTQRNKPVKVRYILPITFIVE